MTGSLIVPVGLNFGPAWLSIVFFIDQDEYYTGVPGEELYQNYFRHALGKGVQCNRKPGPAEGLLAPALPSYTSHEDAMELVKPFSNHIKSAIRMGISALDNDPTLDFKLMAVTVPDHWDESARTLVATATRLAGHPLDGSHMIVSLSRAIQSAYQMSRYNEGKYLTLLLDYNKSYLHLMLVEMYGTHCMMKGQVYFPHLGEDELHKAPVPGSAVASDRDSLNHNALNRQVSDSHQSSQSDDESTNDTSANSSTTSDLAFPINDVHTSGFSDDDAPANKPHVRKHATSQHSTTEAPIQDHPAADNSGKDSAAVPDEFLSQRPVCHNQAAHFQPILDAVSDFIISVAAPETSSPAEAEKPPTQRPTLGAVRRHAAREELRYVVIDGEASIQGLRDLSNAIKTMFVNEEWVKIEGSRRDCGAYGAAVAAMRQVQNPKHWGDWRELSWYGS